MKIIVFTSNAQRHKFVANKLASNADDALVIVECKKSDAPKEDVSLMNDIEKSFAKRYEAEREFFPGNELFLSKTLPIKRGEVNTPFVYEAVKEYSPDMAFVFGSSIIKEPLLSLLPSGKFVNMHLGLSPYYRGSGTNFWPFINEELEYVGATLLHIDPGIDTGDIIAHARPIIESDDTVHSIGCKTIAAGTEKLLTCMNIVKSGKDLQRVKQWDIPEGKYYRIKDLNEGVLETYNKKMEGGLIEKHLKKTPNKLRLVELDE